MLFHSLFHNTIHFFHSLFSPFEQPTTEDIEDIESVPVVEDEWEQFEEKEEEEKKKKEEEEAKKRKEEEEKRKKEGEKKKAKKTKDLLAERDRLDRERELEQQRRLAAVGGIIDKAVQQRMVEEADFRNAQEMFGELSTAGELDGFVPKTADDFKRFAGMLSGRATDVAHDSHYYDFVVTLTKSVVAPMKSEDLRKLIAALNVVLNEKIKAEKGGVTSVAARQKKKTQEQRAKALALKQLDEEPDEEAEDEYARYEDKYDFM